MDMGETQLALEMPVTLPSYATLHARWVNGFGDAVPLTRPTIRVGRRGDNDIVIDDPTISGAHLEISFAQGALTVRDLGSRNGTFVDGRRLPPNQPVPLRPEMTIRLHTIVELRLQPADPTAPPLAMPAHVVFGPRPSPGLVIQGRDGTYQLVMLGDHPLRLGRTPDNDIVIANPVVSAHHAEIAPQAGGYTITDLDSRNGLTCDGQRIKSRPLRAGAVVAIADQVTIRFQPAMGFVTQPAPGAVEKETEPQLFETAGKKTIRIGRAVDNDLQLDDPRVSRYHAVIERIGARYRIRDLRSHNGTFVNGERVDARRELFLAEGDVINIGGARLNFIPEGLAYTDDRNGLRLDLVGLRKEVGKGKNLLQDISLSIYPREFVALVGTSGAGKSTLMDAINGFRPATHGQILVNGTNLYRNFDAYRTEMGYVPQEDIMHRELTVFQALDYAAKLRMPADTNAQERSQRVQEVLKELDLEQRQGLPISKLSGGQRKRVSIGIELLTRPRLFFLDEATSGLDPGTEYELMQLLRQLTEDPNEGRTIVLITHATKNVMLCDKVIFLTKGGYLAFYGPPDEALQYFDEYRSADARHTKPDFEFDDIYMLLDPDKALPDSASEQEKLALAAEWARRYRASPYYEKYVAARLREGQRGAAERDQGTSTRKPPRTSALRQFTILSQRSWSVMRGDRIGLAILLLQAPIIGAMSFINYGKDNFTTGNGATGTQPKALTVLFLAVIIVLLFGTINAAREFTKEISVYKRERMVNLKISPYVLSKVFILTIFCLYQVGIYLAFTMVTIDWPPTLGMKGWSQLYFTLVLASLSGIMLGLVLSALSNNDGQAVAMIPVILIPQFIFAGILMPELADMPVVPNISTSRWAVAALASITGASSLPFTEVDQGDLKTKQAEAAAALRDKKIGEEVDRLVRERLDGEVKQALDKTVADETVRTLARETSAAQDKAESEARKQMAGNIMISAAERERQVGLARQQAATQIAQNRPKIEQEVRAKAEPAVKSAVELELRKQIRAEVEKRAPPGDALSLPEVPNPYKKLYSTDMRVAWLAMLVIVIVLLGVILALQKRKDVV